MMKIQVLLRKVKQWLMIYERIYKLETREDGIALGYI